jgi:hypothetical protein
MRHVERLFSEAVDELEVNVDADGTFRKCPKKGLGSRSVFQ